MHQIQDSNHGKELAERFQSIKSLLMRCPQYEVACSWSDAASLPAIVESGLNEAGTAVAVIVHPERGTLAIVEYLNQPFSAVVRRSADELTGVKLQILLELIAQVDYRDRLVESMQSSNPIQLDVLLKHEDGYNWFGFGVSYPRQASRACATRF